MTALDWLQNEIGGHSSCRSDRVFSFVQTIRFFNLLKKSLADDLPTLKHDNFEIAGKYVESYTAGTLEIGSDVLAWLRQTDGFSSDVDADMQRVVENLPRLRELWPFPLFDFDDLFARVCSEFGVAAGVKEAGAEAGVDSEGDPNKPPAALMQALSRRPSDLLQYLWCNPETTIDKISNAVYDGRPVQRATIIAMVQTLQQKMHDAGFGQFVVTEKNGVVIFRR